MDYFIKCTGDAELRAALIDSGILVIEDAVLNEADEVLVPAHDAVAAGFAIDIIGTISKPTGKMITVDGIEVPEMAPVPGYHANLRGTLSDTQLAVLEPLLLLEAPANPFRVWA